MFETNIDAFEVLRRITPAKQLGMAGVLYSRPAVADIRETAELLKLEWNLELYEQVLVGIDAVCSRLNQKANDRGGTQSKPNSRR